jgi:uncharacterized membrane-anchored protein YitT (DUF2179 family)
LPDKLLPGEVAEGSLVPFAESLAENLLHPQFSISMWEAFGRRYRRNYMWIYLILALAWLAKSIFLTPNLQTSFPGLMENFAIGRIPGWLVLGFGLLFNGALFLIGMLTQGLHQATGEVLPRFGSEMSVPFFQKDGEPQPSTGPAWFRLSRRRQQLLAMVITDQAREISEHILKEMYRGVTAMNGTGMYTGKSHSVLLVALTVTEVAQLKALVNQVDPNAFVIVTPAQEILGRGFQPLQKT